MGEKVRYHGGHETVSHPIIETWKSEGRIVSLCPEVAAGASVPRAPSEIVGIGGGSAVRKNLAWVRKQDGSDCTQQFLDAATLALEVIKHHNIRVALMKSNSPSCGSERIYDGSFSGTKIEGNGVTASALRDVGVKIFTETQIELANEYLKVLEK